KCIRRRGRIRQSGRVATQVAARAIGRHLPTVDVDVVIVLSSPPPPPSSSIAHRCHHPPSSNIVELTETRRPQERWANHSEESMTGLAPGSIGRLDPSSRLTTVPSDTDPHRTDSRV
ncbi:hypothetical protein CH063_10979, partial [Colletotrichum higginsianum]